MNRKKIKYVVAVVLGCILISDHVFAAPPVGSNDAGIQLNRMREYLEKERVNRQIAEDRANIKAKAESETTKQEEQSGIINFELKKVVTGASAILTDAELDVIVQPYVGKMVQLQDIYAIVEKINALYNEKGYVTCRAFLPPQTIADGTVKLLLVEGRTGTIEVKGNEYTRSDYITNRLHLAAGEIANIKEINKDLLLFNATNSTQLRIIMKAGEESGTTDYEIIAYEPRQYTWHLMEDNAGSYTSGEYRTGLFFNAKSLSGNCDNLGAGAVFSEGAMAANAMYSRSVGRSGTKLNLLYSTNAVKTVKGTIGYDILGHANSYDVGIVQPLVVNETTRTEISLDYNRQSSKSDFRTTGFRYNIVDDNVQDVTFGFAMTNYGASSVVYQKHSYVRGYSNSTPEATEASSQKFGFYKFNGIYQKLYTAGQMLNVRADAQWSGTSDMTSSRQFYMGGMYSVRGYKENYIGGDSGYIVSVEYQMPVFNKDTAAFTFFDYGHVYGNGQSADSDRILSSVGLGLQTSISNKYTARLTLGLPLRREFQGETVKKERVHFMISGQF